MSELSTLVSEQTDQIGKFNYIVLGHIVEYICLFVIDTIALAVEDGTENIAAGNEELEKAAAYQQKFRRKVFIILAIAIILGLIVVISLVSSLKK